MLVNKMFKPGICLAGSTVMHVSLNHRNVAWVNVDWINFVLPLNKHYKFDDIGKHDRYMLYFLFIPKAFFSVDIVMPSAYPIMAK